RKVTWIGSAARAITPADPKASMIANSPMTVVRSSRKLIESPERRRNHGTIGQERQDRNAWVRAAQAHVQRFSRMFDEAWSDLARPLHRGARWVTSRRKGRASPMAGASNSSA